MTLGQGQKPRGPGNMGRLKFLLGKSAPQKLQFLFWDMAPDFLKCIQNGCRFPNEKKLSMCRTAIYIINLLHFWPPWKNSELNVRFFWHRLYYGVVNFFHAPKFYRVSPPFLCKHHYGVPLEKWDCRVVDGPGCCGKNATGWSEIFSDITAGYSQNSEKSPQGGPESRRQTSPPLPFQME